MLTHMQDMVEKHRAWVRWLMRREKKEITPLAVDAGLSSTTLSRMKEPDFNGFSQRTINIVMKYYNVPSPDAWAMGMAEDDATPWEGPTPTFDLKSIAKKSPGADIWRVGTNALSPLGVRRGDMVLIDQNVTPENGDIVIAQHYDMQRGAAKTVLRIYNNRHLSLATITGQPQEILALDPNSVKVMGVMTARLWVRNFDDDV